MEISLVIPCYNEEKNIPLLIKKYTNFLNEKGNEMILVDNGSTDNTAKLFKKLNRKNIRTISVKKNIGFGYGLKKGLFKAKGKSILYSHADMEIDPTDILHSIKILHNKKIKIKKNIL